MGIPPKPFFADVLEHVGAISRSPARLAMHLHKLHTFAASSKCGEHFADGILCGMFATRPSKQEIAAVRDVARTIENTKS